MSMSYIKARFFLILAALFLMLSCSKKIYLPVEHSKIDTTQNKISLIDTIYKVDSIYTELYFQGDTIYKNQYFYKTLYKCRIKTDTLYKVKVDTINTSILYEEISKKDDELSKLKNSISNNKKRTRVLLFLLVPSILLNAFFIFIGLKYFGKQSKQK